MTFVLGLLAVVAALSCLLLMFVILLQEPKGGGIASALGGSGMEALGVATGGVNRFTSWVAGIWIGACMIHAVLQPSDLATDQTLKDLKDKPADTQTDKPGTPPDPPKDGGDDQK